MSGNVPDPGRFSCCFITHVPLFRGVRLILSFKFGNPFMHCVTSQYVFKPCGVVILHNHISIATITFATASPWRVPLNGIFYLNSATQWNELQIWKLSDFVRSNSLGKHHLNSVGHNMYVIKVRAPGCVRNDSEKHSTGVTGLHFQLRRSCNPITQSRAFHCHFAHTRAFSL